MMNFFSSNAMVFGMLVGTFIVLSTLAYLLISKIANIKVMEVQMLSSLGFSLWKIKINDIHYKLGWLPISGGIKPLSTLTDDYNPLLHNETEAINKKPLVYKILMAFSSTIVLLLFGIVGSFFVLKLINPDFGFTTLKTYFDALLPPLFGKTETVGNFKIVISSIFSRNNPVIFTFLIFSLIMFFSTCLQGFTYLNEISTEEKETKYLILSLANITLSLLLLWRFIAIFLKSHSYVRLFVDMFWLVLGAFMIGALAYFVLILLGNWQHKKT